MSSLYPQLRTCTTRSLKRVLEILYKPYPTPIAEQARAVRALALMVDDELRFRDPRRKPTVKRGGAKS